MIEQVDAAVPDHVEPGKLHDIPDPCPVISFIALRLALFAHGFWIVRALQAHAKPVCEQSLAVLAQRYIPLLYPLYVELLHGERSLLPSVVLTAIDAHKAHQSADIGSFFG